MGNKETIVNIYLVIENDVVTLLKACSYEVEGTDEEKIHFLKNNAVKDFATAREFESPYDKKGRKMTYRTFSKFEKQGMHFNLFEEIFKTYKLGDSPLVCVTPYVDGELYAQTD